MSVSVQSGLPKVDTANRIKTKVIISTYPIKTSPKGSIALSAFACIDQVVHFTDSGASWNPPFCRSRRSAPSSPAEILTCSLWILMISLASMSRSLRSKGCRLSYFTSFSFGFSCHWYHQSLQGYADQKSTTKDLWKTSQCYLMLQSLLRNAIHRLSHPFLIYRHWHIDIWCIRTDSR